MMTTVWLVREYQQIEGRYGVNGVPVTTTVYASKDQAELLAEVLRAVPGRFVLLSEHFVNR